MRVTMLTLGSVHQGCVKTAFFQIINRYSKPLAILCISGNVLSNFLLVPTRGTCRDKTTQHTLLPGGLSNALIYPSSVV